VPPPLAPPPELTPSPLAPPDPRGAVEVVGPHASASAEKPSGANRPRSPSGPRSPNRPSDPTRRRLIRDGRIAAATVRRGGTFTGGRGHVVGRCRAGERRCARGPRGSKVMERGG